MADRRIPPNAFYVYVLFREDGITPFYIGKGGGGRWKRHERDAWKNRGWKDRIILKMRRNGFHTIPKEKIIEGVTNKVALSIEIDLIQLIGCHPNGPLVNATRGGDGVDLTPEALARRTESIKRAYDNPEVRARAIASKKIMFSDPNIRGKMSAGQKRACADPDVRKRKSDAMKKVWQRTSHREKLAEAFSKIDQKARVEKLMATINDPLIKAKIVANAAKGGAVRWGKRKLKV